MTQILKELIDAAYDSGYYAGRLFEVPLTDRTRTETEYLSARAIDRRNALAERLDSYLTDPLFHF